MQNSHRLPSLNALRAFEAVARRLSFARAAEVLFVTKAAVAQQVRLLEDEIGAPLVERSGRGLRLTESGAAGAAALADGFAMLARGARAMREARGRGFLVINSSASFAATWLVGRIGKFKARHPEIDVLVDLKGFTRGARTNIFAHRAAPIQVNYLGYPGTMGAGYFDYIIADSIVVPPGEEAFYAEKVVRLPDCYQVNDAKRVIAETTPTRKQAGLPEKGFVFASFNGGNISAPVFDAWIGLLTRIEGSVLWLSEVSEGTKFHLHRHAAARGADPTRLIFAPRIEQADHLARHRLADLFLDTLPCSTQAAASDALWAGLPVLTCRGNSFAGRVAASHLNCLGLTQLVTASLTEYAALARWLAQDRDILAEIKKRLAENRSTSPLFDADLMRRNLEEAYTIMWARREAGERPASFDVEAAPPPAAAPAPTPPVSAAASADVALHEAPPTEAPAAEAALPLPSTTQECIE